MFKVLGIISICIGILLVFGILPGWEFVFGPAVGHEGGTLVSMTLIVLTLAGGIIFIAMGLWFLRRGKQPLPE